MSCACVWAYWALSFTVFLLNNAVSSCGWDLPPVQLVSLWPVLLVWLRLTVVQSRCGSGLSKVWAVSNICDTCSLFLTKITAVLSPHLSLFSQAMEAVYQIMQPSRQSSGNTWLCCSLPYDPTDWWWGMLDGSQVGCQNPQWRLIGFQGKAWGLVSPLSLPIHSSY